MALRVRPGVDTVKRKIAHPRLVCIEHLEVSPNGLPEPDYNATLLDLDLAIIDALNCDGKGIAVVIETFAGRRIYYGYVAPRARIVDRFRSVNHRFPKHKITLRQGKDPAWSLYADYHERFGW